VKEGDVKTRLVYAAVRGRALGCSENIYTKTVKKANPTPQGEEVLPAESDHTGREDDELPTNA